MLKLLYGVFFFMNHTRRLNGIWVPVQLLYCVQSEGTVHDYMMNYVIPIVIYRLKVLILSYLIFVNKKDCSPEHYRRYLLLEIRFYLVLLKVCLREKKSVPLVKNHTESSFNCSFCFSVRIILFQPVALNLSGKKYMFTMSCLPLHF